MPDSTTTVYNPLPTPDLTGAVPYDGAANPFTLGVASGDATAQRVVIWTLLTPQSADDAASSSPRSFVVTWEIALDPEFSEVTSSGPTRADPEDGYSVHVDVIDLEPAVEFWYRFRTGDHVSAVGKTATMPFHTLPDTFLLGSVARSGGSAPWPAGAADIAVAAPNAVLCADRPPDGATSLEEQRTAWRTLLSSPGVQQARATAPWLHRLFSDTAITAEQYRAWWEHHPVRLPPPAADSAPPPLDMRSVGSIVDIVVLDDRNADRATLDALDGFLRSSDARFVAVLSPTPIAAVASGDVPPLRALLIDHPDTRFVLFAAPGSTTGTAPVGRTTVSAPSGPVADEFVLPYLDVGSASAWLLHRITPQTWSTTLRQWSGSADDPPIDAASWTLQVERAS